MTKTTALGRGVSTLLTIIAAADFVHGNGELGAFILTGMLVGAVVMTIASRLAEGIVKTIPVASAFTGTIAVVIYWMIRVKMWLDQVGA